MIQFDTVDLVVNVAPQTNPSWQMDLDPTESKRRRGVQIVFETVAPLNAGCSNCLREFEFIKIKVSLAAVGVH